MPLSTRRALMGGEYDDKALNMGPTAYWPMRETSGTVAHCLVNPTQNGTYQRNVATMTVGAGPDGGTAPNFTPGSGDFINIATTIPSLNNDLFSVAGWARVSAAGIWTDGQWRYQIYCTDAATNEYWRVTKSAGNDTQNFYRRAQAAAVFYNYTPFSPTGWFHVGMTASQAGNQLISYVNGIAVDTSVGLNAWTQAINTFTLGSSWSGQLGRWGYWAGRVLGPAEFAELAAA